MPVTRRNFLRAGLIIAPGIVLANSFWIERLFIETNEFYIGSATKETTKLKVVQLSDLHIHSINYQLTQLTKTLNKLHPDLILITGDAIDDAQNISLLHDFLKLIDKDLKKVAILGNREYWGQVDLFELRNIYKGNNCSLLINQSIQFELNSKTISITGVDDFVAGNPDIEAALKEYKPSDYHIILNHCPEYSDRISEIPGIKADFIVSGHTHGGQFDLFGFTPFLPPGCGRYLKGWYTENSPKLYVSKGIGTSIIPARLGASAEIAIFNL
jgi:uncharacterized protein